VICARESIRVDICKRDSGSALVCSGRHTGTTSFTNPWSAADRPAGLVNVLSLIIHSFIRNHSSSRMMKQVIGLVLLGLLCGIAARAAVNGETRAEAAVHSPVLADDKHETKVEGAVQSGRIVNGRPVEISDYPFALNLFIDDAFYCGATIITITHVISTAACTYPFRDAIINRISLKGANTTISSQKYFPVRRVAIHPNYNPNVTLSDFNIAVLASFPGIFRVTRNASPIPLQTTEVACGTRCYVVGWGQTDINVPGPSNVLRYAEMNIISSDICGRVLSQWLKVTSNLLCALGYDGADMCFGDFGSALVCDGMLAGINSFISPRCDDTRPIGFVKMSDPDIRSFILNETSNPTDRTAGTSGE
uniref:Peptidase S1 domain-containing protein n=1 Tax=Anopheles epiroticus TaxID=199890 RepID=A0A182PBY1_9DIPT